MIDTLGFHDTRDLHTELTTLQRQIKILTGRIETGGFHSYESVSNASGDLANLRHQAGILAKEAAMEDQRLKRLAAAVRLVGDVELGFIAYVVFGPAALPVAPLYEVRLIEPGGIYTVPGSVRTNLPADRVDAAKQDLLTRVARDHARIWSGSTRGYTVQVTPF